MLFQGYKAGLTYANQKYNNTLIVYQIEITIILIDAEKTFGKGQQLSSQILRRN